MSKVEIQFEDGLGKNAPVNWSAKINSEDLKLFCDLFTKRLEELVG
jgi:hypothetical protein